MTILAETTSLFARVRRHARRTELRFLLAGLAVFGSVWGFLDILDEVREGDALRLDSAVLLALRDPGRLATPRAGCRRPPATSPRSEALPY